MIALVVIEREANKRNFVDTVSLHHLGLANSTFAALIGFSWTYSIGETPWVSSGKNCKKPAGSIWVPLKLGVGGLDPRHLRVQVFQRPPQVMLSPDRSIPVTTRRARQTAPPAAAAERPRPAVKAPPHKAPMLSTAPATPAGHRSVL